MSDYEIDSRIQGHMLPDLEKDVSWRDITNYSAAIGDENPWYLDDTRPAGIIAPPMFIVAFTWPVAGSFHKHFEQFLPPQILGTVVHASEYLSFLRPILPGERLLIKSRVISVKPTSAGTLIILRFEILDDRNNLVGIEETGSLFRGVPCSSPHQKTDEYTSWPRESHYDSLLWEKIIPIPRSAPWVYDGCTGIVFPIHTSMAFARQMGLPDIILQGTCTLALAAREITNLEADSNPKRLKEIACRFTGMVIPGSSISVQVLKREEASLGRKLHFRVLNGQGEIALSFGYARIE
jgi:acyl dehydratase